MVVEFGAEHLFSAYEILCSGPWVSSLPLKHSGILMQFIYRIYGGVIESPAKTSNYCSAYILFQPSLPGGRVPVASKFCSLQCPVFDWSPVRLESWKGTYFLNTFLCEEQHLRLS